MLFLQFQLGQDRYVLDAGQVIEVLPMLDIKRIPKAPAGVAGVCNYRGTPVPVVDVNELMLGVAARASMSTRIIVMNYPDRSTGLGHPLGMIVEKATQTVRREPEEFVEAGIDNPDAPYLGPVATDDKGLVQWVDASRLLTDQVRDLLFNSFESEVQ